MPRLTSLLPRVSRLRRALGEAGRARIRAQAGGYLVSVSRGELDVSRFEDLLGDQAGQAHALNNIGYCHLLLGDCHQARAICEQGLALHRELGNRHGQASTWNSLGDIDQQAGRLAEAAVCHRHALDLFRELGDRYEEAQALIHLGDTGAAAGDDHKAADAWEQALVILVDLSHPDSDRVRAKLNAGRRPIPAVTPGGQLLFPAVCRRISPLGIVQGAPPA